MNRLLSTRYLPAPIAKPRVVFDMAFQTSYEKRPQSLVSGAGLSLASQLISQGAGIPLFTTPLFRQPIDKFRTLQFKNRALQEQTKLPEDLKDQDKPLFFALTLYDSYFYDAQAEIKHIKKLYPHAKIIVGGPSVNTRDDLAGLASFFPEVTAFVRGDGEKVFAPLIQALSRPEGIDKEVIRQLSGVHVQDGDFVFTDNTKNRLQKAEFDRLPLLPPISALIDDIKKVGMLSLHTSRSCLYRCFFCSHQYRTPITWSAERIVQELGRIKEMIENGILPKEARHIHFNDDDFFGHRQKAKDFLRLVAKDPGLNEYFSFSFQGSVASFFDQQNHLDRRLLQLLTKIKTNFINIGTDGFSQRSYAALGKTGSWRMANTLIRALAARKITQSHYAILTHPESTRGEIINNILNITHHLEKTDGFNVVINIFVTAYEGTPFMEKADELGMTRFAISPTGARIKLPVRLLPRNKELTRDLLTALKVRSPSLRMMNRIQRSITDPEEAKDFSRGRERIRLAREFTINNKIYSREKPLQEGALGELGLLLMGEELEPLQFRQP
ncbi:MAG: hypothetical protein ABIE84_01100 [bacterium]